MKFKFTEPEYTKEMEDWYVKRTQAHIKAVQNYCKKIESYDPVRFKGLVKNAKWHDLTKFREPEQIPYVFITWIYRCKREGVPYEPPDHMKGPMDEATAHHIKNNSHHPEYWSDVTTNLVNPDARDETSQTIDATKMSELAIAEMIADWLAVSKERGNPVEFWANKNINKRWMFTPEQTKLIYELLDKIK